MPDNLANRLINRIGLKTKMTVLLLALSLVPLLLVGAVTVNRANSWGKASEEAHFLQTSRFMASAYSDLFQTAIRELERLGLRLPVERMRTETIRKELDEGLLSRPSLEFWSDAPFQSMIGQVFSSFFLALPDGDVFFAAPYRNLSRIVKLADYPWFGELDSGTQLVSTRLEELSGSSRPIVLAIMPIVNRQGRLVGYLGGQVEESRIDEIAHRLLRDRVDKNSKVTMSMATQQGMILSHTTPRRRGTQLPEYLAQDTSLGISEISAGGNSLLVASATAAPTNWIVRITAPTSQIYKVVHILQRVLIVVTLLTFLLVIFIADYVARLVLSPVQDLERGARMLGSGSLSYRIELSHHTNDELGRLAAAFNQMAEGLQTKNDEIRTYGKNLESAHSELDAMIYATNHNVRSALDDIDSASKQLQTLHNGHASSVEQIHIIAKRRSQISRLNADLVKLIKNDRTSIEYRPFSSQALFEKLRTEITDRQNGDIFIYGEMPELVGDEFRLTDAFCQILENGLKFNRHAMPTVEISTRSQGAFCFFEISDNGVGLLPEQFEKAFELFSRLDLESELDGSGTGLNLARRIFEDHGGTVNFARSSVGEGSTLVIKLPRTQKNSGTETV
jgi:signal transduction histidine kinase